MPFVEIKNSGYNSRKQMMNLINYVISEERHIINSMTGGRMILTGTPQCVYDQMMAVKKQYKQVDGQFMRHIIISPSDDESLYINTHSLYMIAMRICEFFPEHQSVVAIHQETERPHIHIAINTVSFMDGKKIRIYLPKLIDCIQKIFDEYVPAL